MVCSGVAGITVTAEGIPEFLSLWGGWRLFPRSSHSGERCPPEQQDLAVTVSALVLWGTDWRVMKPHFSVTLFSKTPGG